MGEEIVAGNGGLIRFWALQAWDRFVGKIDSVPESIRFRREIQGFEKCRANERWLQAWLSVNVAALDVHEPAQDIKGPIDEVRRGFGIVEEFVEP